MNGYTFNEIVLKAKNIKKNVETEYRLGEGSGWCYYICKAILKPNTPIGKVTVRSPDRFDNGEYMSRQILKKTYLDMAERLVKYVENHHKMPEYVSADGHHMKVADYCYMFSRILVYQYNHKSYPKYANVNSKAFTKPTETGDEIYNYFVKTFGKITCIDDALEKIAGRGYGYYYDDRYSNKESIDRIRQGLGVNCTDATQMMKHVADGTGKYKKIDGIHVKCKGGDGHIFLRITQKDGSTFYRDPAAVLDDGNVTSIWCSDGTVLAVNPSWWLANLNR